MDQLLISDRAGNPFGRGLSHVAAWVAAGCAVVVAAVLALVFAASMVVIAVMASALIAFAGFALKVRRPQLVRASDGRQVLEARRVGHSWVAYAWDR